MCRRRRRRKSLRLRQESSTFIERNHAVDRMGQTSVNRYQIGGITFRHQMLSFDVRSKSLRFKFKYKKKPSLLWPASLYCLSPDGERDGPGLEQDTISTAIHPTQVEPVDTIRVGDIGDVPPIGRDCRPTRVQMAVSQH